MQLRLEVYALVILGKGENTKQVNEDEERGDTTQLPSLSKRSIRIIFFFI